MKTFRLLYKENKGLYSYQNLPKEAVIGLGFFDGVHRGHQELIAKVLYYAAKLNKPAAIYTFDRYPKQHNANYGPGLSSSEDIFATKSPSLFHSDVNLSTISFTEKERLSLINKEQRELREKSLQIKKENGEFLGFIQSEEEKIRTLDRQGLDIVYIQKFDDDFSSCDAKDFFINFNQALAPTMLITGEDFRFGKDRSGNIDLLRELCVSNNIGFDTSQTLYYKGEKISSSRIREAIFLGELELAEELMGRPFRSLGEVLHGQALGSKFGIPTANIRPTQAKVMPPFGVYISFAKVGNRLYRAITHFGLRPTVNSKDKSPLYETFIYDFNDDLYGQVIEISLLSHERDELEFPSLLAMTNQIAKDLSNGDEAHTKRERFEHTYDYRGLSAYRLQSNRFSTGNLDLVFYLPVNSVKFASILFLSEFLTECTNEFPDEAKLSAYLEDKYAADFVSNVDINSDIICFTLSISALRNGSDGSKPFLESMDMLFSHLLDITIYNEEILNSLFESLKKRLVMQVKVKSQKPSNRVYNEALKLVYPNEIISKSADELIRECEDLTLSDVIKTYEILMNQAQRVIVLSGAIDEEESIKIRKFLDKWPEQKVDFKLIPCKYPSLKEASKVGTIKSKHSGELSHACLIYDGISPYNSLQQLKFYLLSEIIAGDSIAILFKSLRLDHSYVYSVDGDFDPYLGIFTINFACSKDNMDDAIKLIKNNLSSLESYINEDVLETTKNYIINNIKSQSDSLSYLIETYLEDRLMRRHLTIDATIELIRDISLQDIKEAANKLDLKLVYILEAEQ